MQIDCPKHDVQELTIDQANFYFDNSDAEYRCPICHEVATLVVEDDDDEDINYSIIEFSNIIDDALKAMKSQFLENNELSLELWMTNLATFVEVTNKN